MPKSKNLQNQQFVYLAVVVFAVVGVVVFLVAFGNSTDFRSRASGGAPPITGSGYPGGSFAPSPYSSTNPRPRPSIQPRQSVRPRPRPTVRPRPRTSAPPQPRQTPQPRSNTQ